MSTVDISSEPFVITVEGARGNQVLKWRWRITVALAGAAKPTVAVFHTQAEIKKELTRQVCGFIAHGYTCKVRSRDATGGGFDNTYWPDGTMTEKAIAPSSGVLGARCSPLPRTKAAKRARLAATRPRQALLEDKKRSKPKVKPKRSKPKKKSAKPTTAIAVRSRSPAKKPSVRSRSGHAVVPPAQSKGWSKTWDKKKLLAYAKKKGLVTTARSVAFTKAQILNALVHGRKLAVSAKKPSKAPSRSPSKVPSRSPAKKPSRSPGTTQNYLARTAQGHDYDAAVAFVDNLSEGQQTSLKKQMSTSRLPASVKAIFDRAVADVRASAHGVGPSTFCPPSRVPSPSRSPSRVPTAPRSPARSGGGVPAPSVYVPPPVPVGPLASVYQSPGGTMARSPARTLVPSRSPVRSPAQSVLPPAPVPSRSPRPSLVQPAVTPMVGGDDEAAALARMMALMDQM